MQEVTFLDRVPTYPGRVTMTPVPGQANTYDMARADSPTVEGTPMDKTTFESVTQSRLTGRYYSPGYTRSQVSSRTGLTGNPIPASGWTVESGVATNSGYKATSIDNDADIDKVFDTSISTGISALNKTSYWVQIELPQAITVKKVQTYVYTIDTEVTLTTLVQGSNNGSSWTTLATINGNQSGNTEVTLSTTGEYKYYRMSLSASASATLMVYTFGITSYDAKTYSMAYTVSSGWPTTWTAGQRATVEIPAAALTGAVTSNTLNGVTVGTILQAGRRYELRYTGSVFDAKEV